MPKDKLDELEQKKLELEAELEQIQLELDDSIHKVRSDVSDTLNPIRFVKEHPWPMVGASLLLGFLVSGNGKKKSYPPKDSSYESEKVFRPILLTELKKLAAKRAVSMVSNFLEDILQSRHSSSLSNGRSVKKD